MRCVPLAALLISFVPNAASAQIPQQSSLRGEVRFDAIAARVTHLHAGLGVALRTGYNVRAHLAAAAGVALRDGEHEESARGEATLRLLLDPFGEARTGLSVGGGLAVLYDGFERTRPVGVLLLGIEGPPRARVVWALELGLGGGARAGLVLRPRMSRYR